jgi:hypothetical protein
MQSYDLHKAFVKRDLANAKSKIHTSFDLWTSGNHLALNGIVAHYLDNTFKSQTITLATPEQIGAHAGVDLAEGVTAVLKDFEITSEMIGYFVLDNASNNDTAIIAIAKEFGFNPVERRLRCAGHIINLIARALLFGFNAKLLEDEDALLETLGHS